MAKKRKKIIWYVYIAVDQPPQIALYINIIITLEWKLKLEANRQQHGNVNLSNLIQEGTDE